jgi:hypothetical protein
MKIIIGTLGISLTTLSQFIYAQTVENELIEKTLETVEKATDEANTLEALDKATPNSLEITEPFQLKNITTNLNNDTTDESAITTEDVIQGTEEALEQANNEATGDKTVVVNETNSNIIEQLKPVSDEMLKYAEEIFPTLNDPTLSREDKVKILNQQFADPELFLQNWKNLRDSIGSLDDDTYGNQYDDSSTLEKQLKLAGSSNNNNNNITKFKVDLGFPTVDFSKIFKDVIGSFIDVEYQSASSVVLRADEETLLLLNGTLAPFWYAIDIVTNHGYQLKEITETGMGSQGNPTRFYAILEKDDKNQQTTTTIHNNNTGNEKKKITNETMLVQNNTTNNKNSLDTTSRLDQKQLQQQPSKENTTALKDTLPESNNTIKILSQDSYIDSIGYMHVIGEAKNNTPNVAQFVEIIGTFYDNTDKVVGTSSTFTSPTDLASGEIAPFDLILSDASIPIEQIERYSLKVSGQ